MCGFQRSSSQQLLDRLECVLNPDDDTESGAKENVKLASLHSISSVLCTQRELENATMLASSL